MLQYTRNGFAQYEFLLKVQSVLIFLLEIFACFQNYSETCRGNVIVLNLRMVDGRKQVTTSTTSTTSTEFIFFTTECSYIFTKLT